MSNTEKLVTRFWRTMAERYGSRWFDTYTETPTLAWRECLDAYSPKEIAKAIEALDLKDSTRQHPPSEPEFRALLKQAARNHSKRSDDPAEWRRGYWRSCIVHAVAHELGYTVQTFEPVLIANRASLGRACADLLDEIDNLEAATGQRTKGQEDACTDGVRAIVVAYNALKAAQVAA